MAKSKKKTGAFGKLVSKIMKRDGIPYKQALAKAKDFLKAGGSLEAIKSKYEIPAATLKTL